MNAHDPQSSQLEEFFRGGRKCFYKKDEIILRAGDNPQGVYYIESGFIKIYSLDKEGNEHIHLFFSRGDLFPKIWIYSDAVRNVYYEAMEDTVIWLVPRDEFKKLVASNSEIAVMMLERVVGLFRLYAGRIDNLLYSDSHERVAGCLISLANFRGKKTEAGFVIDAPLTHQEIASSINLSRETTSRAMGRLQRNGVIGYDQFRHIVIKDLQKLVDIIGEDEVNGIWPKLIKQLKSGDAAE